LTPHSQPRKAKETLDSGSDEDEEEKEREEAR